MTRTLQSFTTARVALGRAGDSLPTQEFLAQQLAHARAREAVHSQLDVPSLQLELKSESIVVHSAASDRTEYLRHPDRGRKLRPDSRILLRRGPFDAVFVIADGLSARAVQTHAAPLLHATLPQLGSHWRLAPIVIVEQGRVAIADEIGELLGAALSVILIGERPGLSSADSLGAYLTWNPRTGLTDANRNCISNIRTDGLGYNAAAHQLTFLMTEARIKKLSGIHLMTASLPPG